MAEVRNIVSVSEDELKAGLSEEAAQVGTEHSLKEPPQGNGMLPSLRPIYGVGFTYMYIHCIYVRDQCKTRTVLKPSDGFEAGQTALKPARRFYNFSLAPPTALKPSRRMSSSRGRFKSCA